MSERVAVLGAGVAGLTVAHELVDRGFDVDVYEHRGEAGGQARSYGARLRDTKGRPVEIDDIPGEHGFRFFPGFYIHLDDTMQRIPVAEAYRRHGRKSVLDCLISIEQELLAVGGQQPLTVPASAPRTVKAIRNALRLPGNLVDVGLTNDDMATFADKLWQIATSCEERRDEEYEKLGWRDFVDSKDRSEEYYWYLASGLTRALVAARARYASTKTMGNIALRLFAVVMNAGQTTDRALCGPTNDVFIDPWVRYITTPGRSPWGTKGTCTIHWRTKVTAIEAHGDRVAVTVKKDRGAEALVKAKYIVSALPVQVLSSLVKASPALRKHEQFANVIEIADATGAAQCLRRMSGLQIYYKEGHTFRGAAGARRLNRGHQLLLDSPWGLTSIDQGLFWDRLPPGVGDVLSIDISSWDVKGMNGKQASACTPLEVFEECCNEMRQALGKDLIDEKAILGWNLDESRELLLVNRVDSWRLRPKANTPFVNFKLAGDFVQTMTDLACMEGANEAGRVAVNAILEQERRPAATQCPIWAPQQPAMLQPLQEIDRYRYERSLPWSGTPAIGGWLVGGAQAGAIAADPLEPPLAAQVDTGAFRVPRAEWDEAAPEMPVEALTSLQMAAELKRFDRYAQPGRSDPMFKEWRLYKQKKAPRFLVPLHIYDADTLIIYAKATNFEYLEHLTAGTGYYPVSCDVDGKRVGFVELWVVRYVDTSTGPCREIAVNFATNTDRDKPRYRWLSPLSAMVPMMDSSNRLFTPQLVLEQLAKPPGCIEYGNEVFGMNKLHGKVNIEPGATYTFSCEQLEERTKDGTIKPCPGRLVVEGEVDVRASRLDAAASGIELMRELGPIAAARNWQQVQRGDEITGGMASRDFRVKNRVVGIETNATYKFAPIICRRDAIRRFKLGPAPLGAMMKEMGFEPAIAAHEPHLKSVLYTDDCPTPND